MKIGHKITSIIWSGDNYKDLVKSFPFYLTRDKPFGDENIVKLKGEARICCGECLESKQLHFFTNIGVLFCNVGESIEFPDLGW